MMKQGKMVFKFQGDRSPHLEKLAQGLKRELEANDYHYRWYSISPRVVFNFITPQEIKLYRRKAQATFVVSILEADSVPQDAIKEWYPYLVRTLSNMLVVYIPGVEAHFLTPDLGHFVEPEGSGFYHRLFERIHPMASSVLVIKNRFDTDLEKELWDGDQFSRALSKAGKKLGEWDLLPAAFPIDQILSADDFRHIKRLYGIGGLSYGNLSVRKDEGRFWMSASGVDKSRLREIGRDLLLVKDYDAEENAIVLSVPPEIEPRRVSVDAIEHWLIYRDHPDVGAIIHVHAWMEGVTTTQFQYPCGTYQLGQAVADKVRLEPDPARAIVGLKNHGLTITGPSLADILDRIDGRLLKHVPMQ